MTVSGAGGAAGSSPHDEGQHSEGQHGETAPEHLGVPAWLRETAGEARLQVTLAVVVMVALQLALPPRYLPTGHWVLPLVQFLLGLILFVANPRRIDQAPPGLRRLSLLLAGVASATNAFSAVGLIREIVTGQPKVEATALLLIGGDIWLTNILVFAVWYWEFDRGGPGARARGEQEHPDFVFPQLTAPELATHDWEPQFIDYLYLSYTNASAFSPTDTLPFSRRAKLLMTLQSIVSLATGALVIARAVNILGS